MSFDPSRDPHRRHNPLTGEWVIVSPQRTQRPWSGQRSVEVPPAPTHDPTCYLCPGNERAGGARNPDYDSTFVFANDFAALLPDSPGPERADTDGLFGVAEATGECRVVCFSPRHDLTLADMSHADVVGVIELWQSQLVELHQRYPWVQIFETRGRDLRRVEPASPRPDLGLEVPPRRGRTGAGTTGGLRRTARPADAARLRRA
ncbi:MAG TPA: galactose-1-phosphate uridylyltransferase [Ilumatobacteraceae bacterium]|nr:galactose-1-phosphate uridylyltransferase [Ilumatobacteraceae bacterium]